MKLDLTKPLSAAMLARAGACPAAVDLVRQHFGSRPLRLTRARLRKAARLGLEMDWLADHLTPEQRRVYKAAIGEPWRFFDAATVEAYRVYKAAIGEPWRVFDAAMDEAYRVYKAATAEALADALGLP